MCSFFSFVTCPDVNNGRRFYYFDWTQRQEMIAMSSDGAEDSHDHIIANYNLDPKECNCYEYNPLLKTFEVDKQNSSVDDRVQAEEWVRVVDWKTIVEPLIVKPIVNPLYGAPGIVTEEVKDWLKQ